MKCQLDISSKHTALSANPWSSINSPQFGQRFDVNGKETSEITKEMIFQTCVLMDEYYAICDDTNDIYRLDFEHLHYNNTVAYYIDTLGFVLLSVTNTFHINCT